MEKVQVERRWQGGKDARVARWQGGKGRRVVKWQSWRFLVLFRSGGHRVSPRFGLVLISNGKKEQDRFKII